MDMYRFLLGSIFISSLTIACYINSASNPFLFDDITLIRENRSIRSFDRVFLPGENQLYLRPLTNLSLWADYSLWGDSPAGFRTHNILLHMIASILLFIFIYILSGSYGASLLSGMIFSSHPIHSEVINMVALGRGYLYATIFSLISLISYLFARKSDSKSTKAMAYPISAIGFFLSILSNELGLLTPICIIIYEYSCSKQRKFLLNKKYWLILILALIPLILFRSNLAKIIGAGTGGLSIGIRSIPYLTIRYLWILTFPFRLSAWYQGMDLPSSPLSLETISSYIVILTLFIVIYVLIRNKKEFLFASVSLIVSISVISMRVIGTPPSPMGERWIYLPSIWFATLLPMSVELIRMKKRALGYWGQSILVLLIALYIVLTIQRNYVWGDNYKLWLDTVSKAPKSSIAHNNLGTKYLQDNKIKEAANEFAIAVSLDPNYPIAHNNLGIALDRFEKLDAAIEEYQEAIKLDPKYHNAYMNMGNTFHKKGDLDKAIEAHKEAIRLAPELFTVHYNLANTYRDKGLWDEAALEYNESIRLNPGHADSHNNLGVVYFKKGMAGTAMQEYKKALSLNRDLAPAHKNMGLVYMYFKDYHNALLEFNEVLKRNRNDIDAHNLLATIYLDHLNDSKNGLIHLEESLRIKPDQKESSAIKERIRKLGRSENRG